MWVEQGPTRSCPAEKNAIPHPCRIPDDSPILAAGSQSVGSGTATAAGGLGRHAWLDGRSAPSGTVIRAMQGNTELAKVSVRGNGRFGPLQIRQPSGTGPVYFLIGDVRASYELNWSSAFLKADVELRAASGVPSPAATPCPTPPTSLPTNTPVRPENSVPGPQGPQGARGPAGPAGPTGCNRPGGPAGRAGAARSGRLARSKGTGRRGRPARPHWGVERLRPLYVGRGVSPRFPRTRGDRPRQRRGSPAVPAVPPHARG